VVVHGGSTTASTAAQLHQSDGGGRMGLLQGGVPFIAGGGDWQRRRLWPGRQQWWNWRRQSRDGHGPNAVGTGGAVVWIGRLTGGPQRFWIFFQFIYNQLKFKIQNGYLNLI
jgi:hypothetical protein